MKLTDLNSAGGIGASAMHLEIGGVNILIDSGLHPKVPGPEGVPLLSKIRDKHIDLIIVTHCHLDHIGSIPVAMREHPEAAVIMSQPSQMLIERMLHNSANVMLRQRDESNIQGYPLFTHEEIDRMAKRFTGFPFNAPRLFRGRNDEIEITLHPAGHVAGAAAVEIRHKHRHIFITGDVLFENQRILPGARFPAGHFDTIITETTRGNTERPAGKDRLSEINRLIAAINDTIKRGGCFLIPVFALGRLQELLTVLADARKFGHLVECPVYASGLGMDIVDYFDQIARKTKALTFSRSVVKDLKIKPVPRKINAGQDPRTNAIYLVGSGMMVERTPSYALASCMLGNAKNTIGFVGFCDPDSPGGKLLASKHGEEFLFETANVTAKINAKVERFELSGHADREELLEFAVQTEARSIILTHGDPEARRWFEQELAARMPATKVLDPVPGQQYQV